jgi:hypothetical protein
MKKLLSIFILFSIITLSLFSCSKTTDTEAPKITITSPVNNQVFAVGDTIFLKATITENDELHHIDALLIKNEAETVWSRGYHSHNQFFEVNDAYILLQTDSNSTFKFEVIADDHNGNEASAYVLFSVE